MSSASVVLLALLGVAFPAPKHVTVTEQTKCDWGPVVSVSPKGDMLTFKAVSGPITFRVYPETPVYAEGDGKPVGTVAGLKPGQVVRVYYLTEGALQVLEIDAE
jgi:hypothetical protein